MIERAIAQVDFKVTGLQAISQAGNMITGLNQALQLLDRAMEVVKTTTVSFIKTSSAIEQWTGQFTTFTGSIDAAKDHMEELYAFAAKTPFQLPEIIDASVMLEAMSIKGERALKASGDMAAAFGRDLNEAILALSSASAGMLMPLKRWGVVADDIRQVIGHDMVRDTKAGLAEIADAVVVLFERRAAGAMAGLAETLVGKMSMLGDAWFRFKKMVGDVDLFRVVRDTFGQILDTVNQLFDQGYAERVANVMGETIARALIGATLSMSQAALGIWKLVDSVERLFGAMKPAESIKGLWKYITTKGEPGLSTAEFTARLAAEKASGVDYYTSTEESKYQILEDLVEAQKVLLATIGSGRFVGPEWEPEWWEGAGGAETPFTSRRSERFGGTSAFPEWPGGEGDTGQEARTALGLWDEEQMAEAADIMDRHKEHQMATISILTSSWEQHYSRISQAAFKWGQGEGKIIKDIYRMTKMSLVASLQDVVHYMTQKAAMKQLEAAAEALMAGGWGNIFSAGKFIAAGAAWGMLGGAVGGMLGGFAAEKEPDFGTIGESAGGGAPESRTISRGVGVKAQNITINIHVGHYGATVYGDGGIRQLWEEHLEPLVEQSFAMGRI